MRAHHIGAGVVTLLVALAVGASAQTAQDLLSPLERQWVREHGAIRHAPDPNYPPFESYDEEGTLIGINADVLNRISRNLGIQFETVRVPTWQAALKGLRNGSVDLLGSVAVTAERETWMDFTPPYAVYGEVFYVTDPELDRVQDLVGKRVGVVRDYAAATWLTQHHPELTVTHVNDTLTGLNMLSRGSLDAFFENVPVAGFYIRQTSLSNIRVMGDPLYYSPSSWAVRDGETVLLSIINKGMASIPPGEMAHIFEYWTGSDISPQSQRAGGLTALQRNLFFSVGLLALAAGGWSVSLRRTVRRRTRELEVSRNALRAANEELEARVADRMRELTRANRDLEAFSYTVSHDLRTPLTTIGAFNEVLQRKHAQHLDDEGKRAVAKIQGGVRRMNQLIEDILRFSRASRVPLERQVVDVSAIARDVAKAFQDRDPQRPVDLRIEPGLTTNGDPRLLRIVLENLMDNAWKFTEGRSPAVVEFGQERGAFFVRDNGAGFDPGESHRLFKPFQRLHETGRFPGSGIGLSTVERILDRHGGRIWAEGAPDRGATFFFTVGDERS